MKHWTKITQGKKKKYEKVDYYSQLKNHPSRTIKSKIAFKNPQDFFFELTIK